MKLESNNTTGWNNETVSRYRMNDFYRSIFAIADAAKERGLVIYGTGYWGCRSLEIFNLFGITPFCFCDDDEEIVGTRIQDVMVLSLDDAAEKYSNAVFILGNSYLDLDTLLGTQKAHALGICL